MGNVVRHEGVKSGILFDFYLNGILIDKANLALRCEPNSNKVNISSYAMVMHYWHRQKNSLQYMLDTLTTNLEYLTLKFNVEKSCNFVSNHKSKKISTVLTSLAHSL